ncbi:HAMP domain-containing histidine kinase [Streptomyces sp. SCA3-4]|uniref:HAMP domain-containing sensor histidine kinase n=1 Tax=Streptomyces sichuanensis TaxID=2871810 RepID=UPI001CE26A27|nr:HAMP domain-containing sensor histidine kinase [Streptomyces sichuanensis]MCA6092514.1 HAMP domain-containing histidine kinase [Streptomyces sichuanensis]
MRTRLLPLLIVLMAGVLLALGFPLAAGIAAVEQQQVVVDRIDDTARFASLAQYVTAQPFAPADQADGRFLTLRSELDRYEDLYGIRAGVFYRSGKAMAAAPADWALPPGGEGRRAFQEALAGRRSRDPGQVWPWRHSRLTVASPVIRDGDVVAVVVTESPTGQLRSRILHQWLLLAAGETAAMLVAVAAAFRLTGWVLKPVRTLDVAAHDIATGRMNSRVAADSGPPELRRLARSFNEMADNVENVLDQQRAFVADASHQLRNPLSALLLRIDLLALDLPEGHGEVASVQAEGKRLARVLDDLLDLALAEHDPGDPQLTDIAEIVTDRVGAWSPVADRERVSLTYRGPAAATGWADPIALSSALDAVVDNALKFTPEHARVEVTVGVDGDRVHISVADGGPGLTEEELTRIGDRFWRSNRHQNVSGSGLGLSISRALLAATGATLSYEHNRPTGLRATIVVPRDGGPAARGG